VVYL